MPYCQFCGTKLEEGQTCTCQMAQNAAQQPPSQQASLPADQATAASSSQVSIMLKNLKSYLTTYFANPAQAVRFAVESNNMSLPIILSVIRLLVMGLAIYGLLRKVCATALTTLTTTLLRYKNAADILTANISASLFKSLLFGALIAAINMLLFIVVVFAIAKIRRGDTSFVTVFKASSANGVATSALLLLAFLGSFVSIPCCLAFIALSMLAWLICGVLTMRQVCPDSESGICWLMYFVGVILVIIAGYYVISSLFIRAAGGISISFMGQTAQLQTLFDTASNSLSSFKSELAEEGITSIGTFFSKGLEELIEGLVTEFWYELF